MKMPHRLDYIGILLEAFSQLRVLYSRSLYLGQIDRKLTIAANVLEVSATLLLHAIHYAPCLCHFY